jgi:hypothetical protein
MDFQALFGDDSLPTVVSDSLHLRTHAESLGFSAIDIGKTLRLVPKNILYLPTSWPKVRPYTKALSNAFSISRVLLVPLAAFDASDDAVCYSLDRLLETDIDNARRLGLMWESRLASSNGRLSFRGNNSFLDFKTSRFSRLNFRHETMINIGHEIAIGEYLESEMEIHSTVLPKFILNGLVHVKAVLAARHSILPKECKQNVDRAQEFANFINQSSNTVVLELVDSTVNKFLIDGIDYLSSLRSFTNDAYMLSVTEFSIGLNQQIIHKVDWKYNSLMNEGAGFMHLALGDGFTGAHMDFICNDMRVCQAWEDREYED